MIKLIVGLGNPGSQYEFNRHNVGFWLVDLLANSYQGNWKSETKFSAFTCRININNQEVVLLKPTTFMNNSGKSVTSYTHFFKINAKQILVVHDELDIAISDIKFKYGGGSGGHNGLRDIITNIGCDFYRLRIGIGRPSVGNVTDFVLHNPSSKEQGIIIENLLKFIHLVPDFIGKNKDKATQKLHTRDS